MWLLVSRLLFLTGGALLANFVVIYLSRTFGMSKEAANGMNVTILLVVVAANVDRDLPGVPAVGPARAQAADLGGVRHRRRRDRAGGPRAVRAGRAGRGGAVRGVERDVPRGRLGADDRHHPAGVGGPVHGPVERGDGCGDAAGDRAGRDRARCRHPGGRARGRAAGRVLAGRDPLRARRDHAAPGGGAASPGASRSAGARSGSGGLTGRLAAGDRLSGGAGPRRPRRTGRAAGGPRGRRCAGRRRGAASRPGSPCRRGPCGTHRPSTGARASWNAAASRHDRGRRNANGSRCRHHHGTADQTNTR